MSKTELVGPGTAQLANPSPPPPLNGGPSTRSTGGSHQRAPLRLACWLGNERPERFCPTTPLLGGGRFLAGLNSPAEFGGPPIGGPPPPFGGGPLWSGPCPKGSLFKRLIHPPEPPPPPPPSSEGGVGCGGGLPPHSGAPQGQYILSIYIRRIWGGG